MVFSSTIFLFGFLPLSLLIYYVMPLKGRNLVLFLLSMAFFPSRWPTSQDSPSESTAKVTRSGRKPG